MWLVDKEKVKKVKADLAEQRIKGNLVEFIKESYLQKGFHFHDLFMHSGFVVSLQPEEINYIISGMEGSVEKGATLDNELEYIKYLIQRKIHYDAELKSLISENINKISIESLFNYIEHLRYSIVTEKKINGISFPSDILHSHFAHVLDCFIELVEIIREFKINSRDSKHRNVAICSKIFKYLSHQGALRQHLNSIMMGLSTVQIVKEYKHNDVVYDRIFFETHKPSFWRAFEIYRDLNFSRFLEQINEHEEMGLQRQSGFLKSLSNDILHLDFAQGTDYLVDRDIYQSSKLLEPIYGDFGRTFSIENMSYSINDLIEVYRALYKINFQALQNFQEGNLNNLIVVGEKSLLRRLGLSSKHCMLIKLMSIDLDNNNQGAYQTSYKPLIRKSNVYYLIPLFFNRVSFEKCMDKILSNEVKLNSNTDQQKGFMFEDRINHFFQNAGIPFAQISRDENKGIPEIDGLFVIDEYVFIFEAKATIKPETILEAYNNLNGKVREGYDQIIDRINTLLDKEKLEIIEEKTYMSLANKKIAPFILTNHYYFNGYPGLIIKNEQSTTHIPVIDFFTLKSILTSQIFPVWQYNDSKNCYEYFELEWSSAQELYAYMLNQINGLKSFEKPLFHVTDDLIMSQIVKPFKICKNKRMDENRK